MRVSTFNRHKQAEEDANNYFRKEMERRLIAAGLSTDPGRFPVQPNQGSAYAAGYQRGCKWAFDTMIEKRMIETRWDLNDGTYAGQGEQDGWNAVVEALR